MKTIHAHKCFEVAGETGNMAELAALVARAMALRNVTSSDGEVLEQMGGVPHLGRENFSVLLSLLSATPRSGYAQYGQFNQYHLGSSVPGMFLQHSFQPRLMASADISPIHNTGPQALPQPSQSDAGGGSGTESQPGLEHMSGSRFTERVQESLRGKYWDLKIKLCLSDVQKMRQQKFT